MHSNTTANPQHMHHHSFSEVKDYLSSHEDFFDNILEKTAEAGGIIILVVFTYMVMLAVYTLNHANYLYENGLAWLTCNMLQEFMHNVAHSFI